ncbi:MAG: TPM domain-containing protein [Tissierellia bacterium]|nr:TPM domain-containing protein [Tissierellia bacterium]
MRRRYLFFILLSILIIFQASTGFAKGLDLPRPNPSFYVYDEANIVDSKVENYIIRTNEELYQRTGAQVVIASINSLENMDIREYANRLFERWEIGSRDYDNGLLIVIVPSEGEIWIEVGYGLEGALPDSKVGRIIEDSILPYFREEDYSEGILSGFNEIIDGIENEYDIQLNREDIDEELYHFNTSPDMGVSGRTGRIFMLIGIVIFLFIDMRFFRGWLTFSLLRGFGNRGGRGGGGGHGGSSGGGGRSGGGGAGGRW